MTPEERYRRALAGIASCGTQCPCCELHRRIARRALDGISSPTETLMNHLKTYIVHYLAIIAGVCAVVAGLDPKVLGPNGDAIVGAAVAGGAIANALGIKPADVVKAIATTAPLLLVGFLLGGCATVSKVDTAITSPQAQPILTAAADVAVATAKQKGISAAEIQSIATQALAADQGASATLAAVAAAVNTELGKLNLPAADVAAAQVLEVALGAAIQAQIGNNATVAQTQAAVADVLNAIIAATQLTAPTAAIQTTAPPAKAGGFSALESPTVIGAATSAGIVGILALKGITVSAPLASAGVVLWTVLAAYLNL